MDIQSVFAINGVAIDLANETLRDASGNSIVLRPQCFAVLRHLIENANRLVTKDELMAAVWPGTAVTDDSLVQCVHEIRRALGDDDHAVLKTMPRRGYRLVLPPEAVTGGVAAAAVAADRAGNGAAPPPVPKTTRHGQFATAAGVVLLVVAAAIAWWLTRGADGAPPDGGLPTIAVLPFDNLGDNPKEDYFADGITEDLITDLSKISGVLVIARNSVWPYKDKPVPAKQVAEDLNVRYVIEGSVRREGDRLRINAQLIDSIDDHHLWAERYDGATSDIFALQDKVIASIASALAVELTSAESQGSGEAETADPRAYDALLQGQDYLRRDTEEDTLKAVSQFEKAIGLDPDYSRAYAALAAAQWRITLSFWFSSSGASWQHAYEGLIGNLAKAKEKPTALAYAISARMLSQQGRYDEAFADIERAMALAPNDPDNHTAKASILNATGHAEQAEDELQFAMRLDPHFAPATLRMLAITLFNHQRYEEAADTLERLLALQSDVSQDYATLVSALGHLGRTESVAPLIDKYNAIAVPAAYDPLTVQESVWDWYGIAFDYHRPYLLQMQEGLRKADVPEGAGTDLAPDDYVRFISRHQGEFDVDGATKVDAAKARELRERGVPFVDVRAHVDYDNGRIPGAVNLSLVVDLSKESLARVDGKDDEIVMYCHGKYCPYSAYGSAKAIAWGYSRIYYFAGGFPEWQDAGYSIEAKPTQ